LSQDHQQDAPDFGQRTEFYTFAPESLASALPEFEILREIGKGSMGVVYEARRRADGLRVALKILPPSLTLTERALARFLREGELMERVRHPGIVQVFEHGRRGRLHWFAMEFVDGTTLDERLRVGPLPARKAAEIAAAAAQALQFAHDRGVLHRDVKPGNLMLRDDGRVAITDFGLARETGTGSMTESGAIVGTPMYMSPEQALGERVDVRADVYGLGATLYQLLTGRPPFEGASAQAVLKAVLEREPVRPSRLRADLPEPLETIVLRALEKNPRERYGSALELAQDLERFLRGERILARRPGALRRLGRHAARHPLAALLAMLVLLLGAGATMLLRDLRVRGLEAGLATAESALDKANSIYLDQQGARSAADRRALLHDAVAAASEVLAREPSFARAWFVRAKAHHRLQNYADALRDLDSVEAKLGHATQELLHFRIDTLSRLGGPTARERLQRDLATLLATDPGARTRCLVADHLFQLAERAQPGEREQIVAGARRVLEPVRDEDARVMLARARLLELEGDAPAAETAIRAATRRYQGDPLVHARAAAMFRRLGLDTEAAAAAELAQMLAPGISEETSDADPIEPVDLRALEQFLQRVDTLLTEIGARRDPPASDKKQ
jgi:tetratricopeptide (TPR) repeat protein